MTIFPIIIASQVKENSLQKENHEVRHLLDVLKRKNLWKEFFLAMVLGGAFGTLATFIPLQTMECLGTSFLPVYFGVYSFVAIVFRFFFSFAIDRYSPEKFLLFGFALVFWKQEI
ncbi:MAG: MFS transporter [Brevinematales bacterium]